MPSSLFPRLPWSTWAQLVLGLLLTGRSIQRFSHSGFTLWNGLVLAIAAWMIFSWYTEWRAARESVASPEKEAEAEEGPAPEEEQPIRSLVFFLDEPRRIDGAAWIGHLGKALNLDLTPGREDATEFVMPMPHPVLTPQGDDCFMLKIPEGVFWIFHVKSPYIEDLANWASRIPDQRLREAVEGHRAWISVDLLTWLDGPDDPARIYGMIGKILAALAGPDVRVVFAPELQRANEFDPILLPRLSGGDPLALFEDPTFAPVLRTRTDDEQMEAAVDEARRRWPEFVRLFGRRDPASERPYIVKAPFSSAENTEHMWMIVTAVEGTTIHGTLANQPHHLLDYHEGQQVAVEASELTDWLCADENDQPLGGWTQKVLNAQNRRSRSGS